MGDVVEWRLGIAMGTLQRTREAGPVGEEMGQVRVSTAGTGRGLLNERSTVKRLALGASPYEHVEVLPASCV